ncbi:hypothetical protein Tco_0782277 [Tanacetum coccineum]
MLSLYMRCSKEESRCYRYTLDVQRMSRDAIAVHDMDESRCYHYTLDVQRMNRYTIVVHEMFNGGVEMLSLYMRCSTDESRWHRCTWADRIRCSPSPEMKTSSETLMNLSSTRIDFCTCWTETEALILCMLHMLFDT